MSANAGTKISCRLLLVVPILLLATVWLRAVTETPLRLSELIQRADWISHARCINKYVAWNDAHTLILTYYTFEAVQNLKQSGSTEPEKRFHMAIPGGQIGNTLMQAYGLAIFEVGEEAVLFMEQTRAGLALVGQYQAKFPIRQSYPYGKKLVENRALIKDVDLSEMPIKTITGGPQESLSTRPARIVPLENLVAYIDMLRTRQGRK